MHIIYLDHNTLHYFVWKKFPRNISQTKELAALEFILRAPTAFKFAISYWNLIEPCWEADPVKGVEALLTRYSDFIQSLKPLYLPSAIAMKRMELMAAVLTQLGNPTRRPSPFFGTFAEARQASGTEFALDANPKDFMLYLVRNPIQLQTYKDRIKEALDAQNVIRDARCKGDYKSPKARRQILNDWLRSLIPSGLVVEQDLESVLQLFLNKPALMFSNCPSMFAEDVFSDRRSADLAREPQEQDAFDLMHAVPALAYCDVYISNDGFVRNCANQTLAITQRSVVVESSLSNSLKKLGLF